MHEALPPSTARQATEHVTFSLRMTNHPGARIAWIHVAPIKALAIQELQQVELGLKGVENKLIGALSKGYRQRVGLADALVAEPDLLILDEPTIGLDPNQIRQVRELIKNLGEQHTILLSTHILPEVEMTCSRVIIIHKGRIEACDTPENLLGKIRQAGGVVLEAKVGKDIGADELKKISGVREVITDGEDDWTRFSLRVESGVDVREEVFRLATERHWAVRELTQRRATLEDVFVEITHSDQV